MAEKVRSRATKLFSPGVVILAVVALVAAVLDAEGYRTPELKLHDAGVWISWAANGQVGRTNTQISQVDVKVDRLPNDVDLLQSDEVVLVSSDSGLLRSIDGKTALPGSLVQLPAGSQVDLAGPIDGTPTSAVLSPDGQLWVASGAGVVSLGFPSAGGPDDDAAAAAVQEPGVSGQEPEGELPDAVAEIPGATHLAVGLDGIVRVLVAASGEVRSYDPAGALLGSMSLPDGVSDPDEASFSMVGAQPVVLDRAAGTLLLPEGLVTLDDGELGGDPQLQLTGPVSSDVLVATSKRLVGVPLDGGAPVPLTDAVGTGGAAQPIRVGGCVLSAWNGSPKFAEICGDGKPIVEPLVDLTPEDPLRFRTNRGKVVLNGLGDGKAVVIADGVASTVDWSQAEVLNAQDEDAPPTESESHESDPDQKPPVAVDDTGDAGFGTRPDRAVVIDPMRNDSDPNDDVLVIEEVTGVTQGAKVDIIQGGLALQVTPAPGQGGTIQFRYWINDGIPGSSDDAAVEVAVHPFTTNSPPVLDPEALQTYVVKGNPPVSHNVLAGAFDPDGDPVELLLPMPAPVAGTPGTYTASSDGTITYDAPGTGRAGDVTVPFVATDGTGQPNSTTPGDLTITVRDQAGQAPKARGDHAETVVGRAVLVDVLANDSDADGDTLRVFKADPVDGAEVSIVDGKIRVVPSVATTLRIPYFISDGTQEAQGQLRVDVGAKDERSAPVAVRDDVVLNAGSPTTVDVLVNDGDADGDVLVVVSVAVQSAANLSVEVIGRRYLRISSADGGALSETTSFLYKITDGEQSSDGVVVVRPGPTTSEDQSPNAVDDKDQRVRAGNVAAFSVLANDSDPEGAPLRVQLPDDLEPSLAKRVFIQGDLLRFVAPSLPGTISIPYQAVDPGGRATRALVEVTIDPVDVANVGPRPPDLAARTVSGEPVEIPVPAATMDPNGDAVTLLGVGDEPPLHGSIIEVTGDHLTYLPDQWDKGFYGTDTFSYRVRDSKGAEATATIRVGVAPPPLFNSPPVAIDDVHEVSPGGQVRINVIRNDSDPDDDRLSVEPKSMHKPADVEWTVESTKGDQTLLFSAAEMAVGDQAVFTYEVTDGILRDRGFVTVTVAERKNLPPVALDDIAPAAEPGRTVRVDVLENDLDPDGSNEELEVVALEDAPDGAEVAGRFIRFDMPVTDVALRYVVEDAFGGQSRAVLRVRALDDTHFRPVANYDFAETDQDVPITTAVLDNDEVSPGRTLQLVRAGEARNGTCEMAGDDSITFRPAQGFVGLAGCAYTISDGAGNDDKTKQAVGMLGVKVRRVGNTAPVFRSQPVAVVAHQKTTVDLLPGVFDPDDGDRITFSGLKGMRDAVDARFDGTELTVEAGAEAATGVVALTFDVSDGTATVQGSVMVSVSEFTGSLAVLAPDLDEETAQSVPIEIDVLANDQPAPTGEELRIIDIPTQPIGARAVVSSDARTIRFEPDDVFHGKTTFEYTVDDGTEQSDRQVTATVIVNVIGFPDRPPAPTAIQDNQAINLSWGVPADNGAPITEYWVKAAGGPVRGPNPRRASGNAITFDGLTNSTPYTFQIAAVNRAAQTARDEGKLTDWQYSAPSIPLEPNAKPPVPTNLTATFLPEGGAITLTWDQPTGEGREPKGYDLQISPTPLDGPALQEDLPASARDGHRVEGLENGTTYEFKVRAINILDTGTQAEGVSEFSSPASEFPSTKPAKMAKPDVVAGDIDELVVTWVRPQTVEETGGAPILSYNLYWYLNGDYSEPEGTTPIPDPNVTQREVRDLKSGESYTFKVAASNRVPGESELSDPSIPRDPEDVPLGTTSLTASDGDNVSVLTPGFPSNHDQGSAITRYEWRKVPAGSPFPTDLAWNTYSASGASAPNGGTYQFQLRACNARGCSADPGVTSNPVSPYGAPSSPPSVSGNSNGTKTITWTWGNSQPNGATRAIVGYEVRINGGGWTGPNNGSNSHRVTVANWGDSATLEVRAVSDAPDPSRRYSSPSGAAVGTPAPLVTVYKGSSFNPAGCSGGCKRVMIKVERLNVTGVVRYTCYADDPPRDGTFGSFWTSTVTIDGNGFYDGPTDCAYGYANGGVRVTIGGVSGELVPWG